MVAMTLPAKPWTNGMMTADGTRMFDSTVGSEGAWRATPIPAGGLPAGSIIQWVGNSLPANYLSCDGSAVSRTTWPSLFAAIGTTYGAGDGSTTFNLPDIPNGDTSGIVGNYRGTSQISVTGTNADLSGVSVTASVKAGRTYKITFSSPNINGASTARTRFNFIANGVEIDRSYVSFVTGSGGTAVNISTLYSPSIDASMIFKMQAFVDNGTPPTTVYADNASFILFTVEDIGEAAGSSLRTRAVIKATTGWSAGDSELALRMAAAETNASTTNKSGLVPVIPTSVVKDAGTVTVNANGKITFSGVTTLRLNGIFSGAFSNYRFFGDTVVTTTANNMNYRFCKDGIDYQTLNYMGWGWYLDYNSGGYDTGQSVINQNAGKFGYAYAGTGTMFFGDILDPFIAAKPSAILSHQINGGTMWWRGNFYNNNVSADGITFIFPNAASGSFTFYGYKD